MKTRALLLVSCLAWAFSASLIPSVFGQTIVGLELVEREAMETRIDQNAIFWAEFRVVRSDTANTDLVVILNAKQGTATLGEDYRLDGVNEGSTVRIPAGAKSVNVRVYPIDDNLYEGDETVRVSLVAPPVGYGIDPAHSSVEMVIHDNDPATTRLVIVSPRDGQQFKPGDVIELRAQVFGPGSTNFGSVEFFDGDRFIGRAKPDATLRWSDASGGKHVISARATDSQGTMLTSEPPVTIQVGPGADLPVVKITADPWRTGEPCPVCLVAPAVLTIERTAPTNSGLKVYLEFDGTAISGVDYQLLPASVEIPAGQRSVELKLLAIDDQLTEGPEVVRVRLLPQPPPLLPPTYFVDVHAKEAFATIFDDEGEALQARLDIITPTNGAQLEFPSVVQLSALAVNVKGEVYGPVDFYAGDRFVARSPVLTSNRPPIPGLPSVHTAYWTNPPVGQYTLTARTRLSLDQTLTSPPIKVTVGPPLLPVVGLRTTPRENPQAPEFCPPGSNCVYPSFVVLRTGSTNDDLRIYLSYSGTATSGTDYPALPESIVIPAGSEAASLIFVPKDDELIEGPESVIASFTPVPGAGYIQDPNHAKASITILDNDGPPLLPVVSLRTTPRENPQAPEFCPLNADCAYPSFVVLRTGSTNADLRVYLSYSGTATPGIDYPALPESTVIPAGREAASLMLVPKDDDLIEGSETVIASFTPVPGAGYVQDPNHAKVAITILDSDGPRPTVVSIRAIDSKAIELPPWVNSVDPATFQVSRSGDLSKDLLVFFSVGGTAKQEVDYRAIKSPVLIPAGEASTNIVVWPIYDELKEGMETVLLRLEPSPIAGPLPTYEIDPNADFAVAGILDLLPEQGPVIEIVSPLDGEHFGPATPINVIVGAYHPTQDVLGADLYSDADKLGEWRLDTPAQNAGTVVAHRFTWSQPTRGSHALTARGLDSAHTIFATSPPVNITVEGELSPPVVSIETISRVSEESSFPLRRLPLAGVFRVSRTGPVTNSLPVYVTSSGSAVSGLDYRPLPFLVTIPEGTNSVLFAVDPVVDDLIEGLETVVAKISNCPPPPLDPPCYNFTIDPTHDSATVFIRDDGLTEASLVITSPTNGASFKSGETILIKVVAIDLDSYISRVEFYDGDHLLGVSELVFIVAPPPGTPIEHSFEWRGASPGTHALTARAARTTGEIVTSQPVRISVDTVGNQPPVIAITHPLSGEVLPPGYPIEIIVNTVDLDGYVHTVEFYADERKIGERSVGTKPPPEPGQPQIFNFPWITATPGPHTLTAVAIDDAGASVKSAPVEMRVAFDLLPIVAVSSTDNFAAEPTTNSELDTATFRIRRFGPTNTPLTVVYSMHGTATNGIDYELLSGSAVIPAGSLTTNITVRPLPDQLVEGFETVILRLEEQPDYRLLLRRRALALIGDTRLALATGSTRQSWLPDGCFQASFGALSGAAYRVEASTDLLNWETVLTTTAVNGSLDFVEDQATNFSRRFYRLVPETVPGSND
jgi:hypothetical protein